MGEQKPCQGVVQEFKKCTGSTAKAKGRIHENRHGGQTKEATSHLPAAPSQRTTWGFEVGATQPTLLSSLLGGAFSSIQMTWNNLNVSFWTETGSNYAKKLEDSQYSNDSTFILTTKMYLCSHRQAFAIWSGHKALPNWAKGRCLWEEWDIKVRPCAWLAGRTALESRDKQRWSHTTYTPSHPQEGKWVE